MLHKTKIGVCMDEGVAYLLEEKNDENVITIIGADESPETDMAILNVNRRKSVKDHAFFKKIFEIIKDFDTVFLFGTASVKNEILSRIKANKLLDIEIQNFQLSDDNITENEKIEFINRYFETNS